MKAVFKKEFRSLLTGMTGPLMTGAVCAVIFLYFIFNNLIAWASDIAAPMHAACILGLTFAIPFLTMRTFAGEAKAKTDQLYMTAPVSVISVVFGKFFAIAALLLLPVFISCLLPLILAPYGNVQFAWCYTSVLCFYLYALMLVAIGMFISTLTSNSIAAGIMSFLFMFLGAVLGSAYNSIGIRFIRTALQAAYDFESRISTMMSGLFDIGGIVYFISITLLFLGLSALSVSRRRFEISMEQRKNAIYALLAAAGMVILCIILNLLAQETPQNIRVRDVTANKLYSLTSDSKEAVRNINDDITLWFLASETEDYSKDTNIERLLEDYAGTSGKITLKYADPVIQPQFYASYSDTELSANSVVVENTTNGRYAALDYQDLVITSMDYSTFTNYITGYDAEGRITNAIQRVTAADEDMIKAYLTTGHGERSFDESFSARFEANGISEETLNLQTSPAVPDDADMLIIYAPVSDFSEDEYEKILAFTNRGGSLMAVTTYEASADMNVFGKILSIFEVKENRGIVMETDPEGYYYSGTEAAQYYIFPLVFEDEVTNGLTDENSGAIFSPLSSSFDYSDSDEEVTNTPLLITSDHAYLKTNIYSATPKMEEGDIQGRQTLALKSVKNIDENNDARALFFSSGSLFTYEADTQVSRGMNGRLFSNSLQFLAGEGTSFVTVPVKYFNESLQVKAQAAIGWAVTLILIVPVIWICGALVWRHRRRL